VDSDIFFVEGAALNGLSEHPLCAFVPASAGVSARDRQIVKPVVLLDGMPLDGRARVREAIRADLPCPCRLFDPEHDGHPALFIAQKAREQRALTKPECAVMAVRLLHQIMHRPAWLEPYDNGLANRLRTAGGRDPFLRACGISRRTYQRVQGIHDHDLLDAISDERVSLRDAHDVRDLGPVKRRRIFAQPRAEQEQAFIDAIARAKKREPKTRPLDFPKRDHLLKLVRRLRAREFQQGSWVSCIRIKGDSDE